MLALVFMIFGFSGSRSIYILVLILIYGAIESQGERESETLLRHDILLLIGSIFERLGSIIAKELCIAQNAQIWKRREA